MEAVYDPAADALHLRLGPAGEASSPLPARPLSLRLDMREDGIALTLAPIREGWLPFLQSLIAGAGGGPAEPPWHPVRSSMISAVRYHAGPGILEVAFNKGVYLYFGVPREVFEGLLQAESKGRYMRQHVIDRYPWIKKSRLRPPPAGAPEGHPSGGT